jgi:hypothetical protein
MLNYYKRATCKTQQESSSNDYRYRDIHEMYTGNGSIHTCIFLDLYIHKTLGLSKQLLHLG